MTPDNPYQAPAAPSAPLAPRPPWSGLFFGINFGLAALLASISVLAIPTSLAANGGSPFAFLVALILMAPALVVARGEWRLYIGRETQRERGLGILCCVLAAFVAFGFVSNVFEAAFQPRRPDLPPDWTPPGPAFWLTFALVSGVISGYGFWCGIVRIRRAPKRADRRDELLKQFARR